MNLRATLVVPAALIEEKDRFPAQFGEAVCLDAKIFECVELAQNFGQCGDNGVLDH